MVIFVNLGEKVHLLNARSGRRDARDKRLPKNLLNRSVTRLSLALRARDALWRDLQSIAGSRSPDWKSQGLPDSGNVGKPGAGAPGSGEGASGGTDGSGSGVPFFVGILSFWPTLSASILKLLTDRNALRVTP